MEQHAYIIMQKNMQISEGRAIAAKSANIQCRVETLIMWFYLTFFIFLFLPFSIFAAIDVKLHAYEM